MAAREGKVKGQKGGNTYTSVSATQRLQRDYKYLLEQPIPDMVAHPLPTNILEWRYVFRGPKDSPYQGGYYHGKLVFPTEFPFKPPAIYMITPSGRFHPNTRLCLSISDYHPESWNPAWTVSAVLVGLLSFMTEDQHTTGSISTSKTQKVTYATASLDFNLRDPLFVELFPEIVAEIMDIKNPTPKPSTLDGDKRKGPDVITID